MLSKTQNLRSKNNLGFHFLLFPLWKENFPKVSESISEKRRRGFAGKFWI